MGAKVLERTKGALLILLVCLISTSGLADEYYLCIGEQTTGFDYNKKNKRWSTASFHTNKWMVKKSTDPSYKQEVWEFGDSVPTIKCGEDFDEFGSLVCGDIMQFRMNKNSLRYLYIYPVGYWSDTNKLKSLNEGENTPLMEIGKCSKI